MAIRSRRRPQGPDARRSRSPSRRPRESLATVGPAFVAAIAYVDPDNFATNALAGAEFGYALVWVVGVANLMAMLVQGLSAKLGVATGGSLPELCRERFSPKLTRGLWPQAEVMAMATDLAELVGGAVVLNLLFGIALFPAAVITAIATLAILTLETANRRALHTRIWPRVIDRRHVRRPGGDAGLHRAGAASQRPPAVDDGPALILIAAGAEPSRALVLSQVVLSFGIPFVLVPLLLFTGTAS